MNLFRRLFNFNKKISAARQPSDLQLQNQLDVLKETVHDIDERVSELESSKDPFDAFVRSVRGDDRDREIEH
jgi:hypothetical protein